MERISAAEAAALVHDGDAVVISGSGGGHSVPEALLAALEARWLDAAQPRGITSISVVGIGDRAALGATHLAHEGLLRRAITGALVDSPGLVTLAAEDRIEAYTLPQGVLSQLMREMAAGRPGLITKTGLHTFVDPRQQGARQSPRTPADFVELMELDGEQWLRFKPLPLNVAFLRGTTADEDGNVTMEQEAVFGEMLAMAQATRRAGGVVIVQVKRMARRNTLPPKQVKIPGILVDFVVVEPGQRQTYATDYDPSYSGELRVPLSDIGPLPFGPRKVIVRRAAMELYPEAVCNLGAGISTGLSTVAAEEGILDAVVLTNEQGLIGGAPITGRDSGGAQNYAAMIDQPAQFDFYDGGGLDLAFLSFAEVDAEGNVNISRFGDKIVGVGGFINISQNAKCVVFSGTLTAGGLDVGWENGQTVIRSEGRHRKFVRELEQVCYSAAFAREHGHQVLFVTERAVFRVSEQGLMLTEIAPGIDLERDVLGQMAFRPAVSPDLKVMDARLFLPTPVGMRDEILARERRFRSARVAAWHAEHRR
ncbi:acyl CoA:acetate/3-ketoacid CoA transferase [Burkholderia gladioli]|uniref:Acetate CoA-transferase YdiF n=1 Tax=Burkholderia gladioli (strain BSR3) TaxID=999541 RepID=F2LK23_BURGS|nr:CoA-transferase [Burkholderia gladioli]AEA62648.1 coenzyme A transferase domain protein [Burkholderia gladioli BSR3]MBW5280656.1 3-oxoacid CoA-transferase [Burkholderia gladioli]